jgi:predicted phosphodiesterase
MSIILALSDTHLNGPLNDNRRVFRWSKIPGEDEENLKKFLTQEFGIDWVKTAKFEKNTDDMTINAKSADGKIKSLSLKRYSGQTQVSLEINCVKTYDFRADVDLNIYENHYYPTQLRSLIKKADLVLHAGDFVCQDAYTDLVRLCDYSKCELWAIQGNNPFTKAPQIQNIPQIRDYSRNKKGDLLPDQKAENWFGINIALMHIVFYEDPTSDKLSDVLPAAANKAQVIKMTNTGEVGADVLVFGHIHEPVIKWIKDESGKRRLLVCPGPGSRDGLYHNCSPDPTVALMECHNGSISSAEIIAISWPKK